MEFNKIKDIKNEKYNGLEVKIRGWVYRKRTSKNMNFIILRDSSDIIQCTLIKSQVKDDIFKIANDCYIESSLEIKGKVSKDDRAIGGYELIVIDINPISIGMAFPISKDLSTEFILDQRHLWIRSRKLTNIMILRHFINRYFREYLDNLDFFEVTPPLITRAGCEGGATLFPLKYFEDSAYLTQSSQLYAESFIYSLEKVYVFAPSFRMEPSRTVRHLSEYWHLEPEMAYYDNSMNMKLQENLIEYVCKKISINHGDLIKEVGRNPLELLEIKAPFNRISYDKAIEKVNELGGKLNWGDDFGVNDEKLLTKELKKPIFIENFPKKIKSFYMAIDPKNDEKVICSDMLAPEGYGEMVGGSQRIHEYDLLIQRMKENNLNEKDYQWYVDLRKYGSVPHSGFGLGIERFIMWVLKLDHIRDTTPYPRVINRFYP